MKVITFNNCRHGFLGDRGIGTATIEGKLVQQLAYLKQVLFYGIFLDLRQVYDAMDRDKCLLILKGYGVAPKVLQLIKKRLV